VEIEQRQKQLIDEMSGISSWEERYQRIIAMGKALPGLPAEKKQPQFLVKGCQSQVWLHARLDGDRVVFEADSDAIIVRGLIAILLKVYSAATPQEILDTSPEFITELGFKKNLSPSRANGLFSMIKQIKYYAAAFKVLLEQKRE
jgi:cysteine desulfuration protein SufE